MVPRYSDNARSNGDSCGGSNAVVGITDQLGLDEEGSHENEFIVKKEIAEWLWSLDYDSIWASRTRKHWENFPSANYLARKLKYADTMILSRSLEPAVFDTLVTVIALQLLASCSTFLPPSSAENLPLYQQHTEYLHVSALRLHSQYRFAPAAGHHARACSEMAPWPGLCALPERRNASSQRNTLRRQVTSSSECVPIFSESGWTDGLTPEFTHDNTTHKHHEGNNIPTGSCATESSANEHRVRWNDIPSSASEDEPKFLSWIMCQSSTSKSPKRKHNSPSQRRLRRRKKVEMREKTGNNPAKPLTRRIPSNRLQYLTVQAV